MKKHNKLTFYLVHIGCWYFVSLGDGNMRTIKSFAQRMAHKIKSRAKTRHLTKTKIFLLAKTFKFHEVRVTNIID